MKRYLQDKRIILIWNQNMEATGNTGKLNNQIMFFHDTKQDDN